LRLHVLSAPRPYATLLRSVRCIWVAARGPRVTGHGSRVAGRGSRVTGHGRAPGAEPTTTPFNPRRSNDPIQHPDHLRNLRNLRSTTLMPAVPRCSGRDRDPTGTPFDYPIAASGAGAPPRNDARGVHLGNLRSVTRVPRPASRDPRPVTRDLKPPASAPPPLPGTAPCPP